MDDPRTTSGSTNGTRTLRVLCLEDSPEDVELVREMLAGIFQLEMKVASDRPNFDKLLAGGSHDVILADYSLPGFDAHSALELAKMACPTTPFICVSGVIGEEATVELLKAGADDCVLKDRLARLPFAVQRAIDERAREAALRLSEEKCSVAFHASPDSISITRLCDGELVEVNEGFERMFGYTRAESVGKTTVELSVYADSVTRDSLVTRLRETGEVKDFDATLRRKDGTLLTAMGSARILDFEGEECFLAVTHDVTEQRKVEEDRLRAEKFFRDTFEHADVGIAHVNSTDGSWLRVNQCMCDLLGYTRKELLATTFAAITHPDDVEENVRHLHGLVAGEEDTYAAEKRYLRKDGSIVWVDLNVALIRKEDGTPDYNITVMTDITEHKRAEKALASSESRLKAMFDQAPVGIALLESPGGRIQEANARYFEITGWSEKELVARGWEGITHPDDVQQELRAVSKMIAGEIDGFTMAKRYVGRGGQVVWAILTVSTIKAPDLYLCMVEDITADKAAEDLAAQQAERIERTLTSVIDIAGDIVELRDPYTAGHQQRVSELAVRIAQDLGMSGHEIADIRVAGLLHDMGKVAVPAEILSKPGQLSPIELALIQGHAEAGYQLAVSANMAEPIADMIHQHHERCDGSGYPLGLTGDQTLLGAKVLAVADVVEAMMSFRPYRPALGIKAALAEIEHGAGSLYDAWVAEACVRLFREDHFEFSA